MCDFSKGFILCVCKDEDQLPADDSLVVYEWYLNKYIGPNQVDERGRYVYPTSNIGVGLTADFVLKNLNSRNCFDFDYTPNEGDNLVLYAELTDAGVDIAKNIFRQNKSINERIEELPITGRIEFIFQNNQWVVEHYNPFADVLLKLNAGKIKQDSIDNT